MAHTTVADVVVDTLRLAGMKRCYGIAGDSLNHFTDSIRRRDDVRWIHVRHEEAGGFAAGADALLTGGLTVCAGSCGPGSLHFINGVMDAHRSRAPVLLVASQIAQAELGFEFPQEVDFKAVYRGTSVFCEEIRTVGQARRMTAMAAQAALSRRGLAVLIVPQDIFSARAIDEPDFAVHRPEPVVRPSDAELQRIADALSKGRRVAIYGGSGCEHAHDAVVALAQKLNAPVARTSRAKDFLEHDNPNDVGMTGIFGVESGFDAVAKADTLLLLGCDFAWRQFYPEKATIIQVDLDGSHLGRRHPVDIGVVGDVRSTLEALLPLVPKRDDTAFLDEMLATRDKAVASLQRKAVASDGPLHPQFLVETIARHAAPDAVYAADTGSPMVWCLRHVPSTGSNRTLLSLTHGTMANAMPQALGAQAAFPQRQVIALCGDGGFAMLMGEMLTAVQEKLPVKIAIFDNGSLNFVEIEQKVDGLLDTFTDLKNPDFGEVARACGLWGRRVERAEALDEAVREWLAQPGPAVLDVLTDPNELVMPPKVEAGEVLGTALYAAKGVLAGRTPEVLDLIKGVFKR